jgi:membrane protein
MLLANLKAQGAEQGAEGKEQPLIWPQEIPLKEWRDIAFQVKEELVENHVSIIAAGIAFYSFLALFPLLMVIVSFYGLIASPVDIHQQLTSLSGVLPKQAQVFLDQQLYRLTTHSTAALSAGVTSGALLVLWITTRATKALMTALNIIYREKEKRRFLKRNGIALLLTGGNLMLAALAFGLIVLVPASLTNFGLPTDIQALLSPLDGALLALSVMLGLAELSGAALLSTLGTLMLTGLSVGLMVIFALAFLASFSLLQLLVSPLPWLLLALSFMVGLAVLYRYGPSRSEPPGQWVSWGAGVATLLWILGSALFSFYVAHFAQYDRIYGSVGAVIILLSWFFLTSYIVLLGAELNVAIERRTKGKRATGQ